MAGSRGRNNGGADISGSKKKFFKAETSVILSYILQKTSNSILFLNNLYCAGYVIVMKIFIKSGFFLVICTFSINL